MSWFDRYMQKWSQGDDGFNDYVRNQLPGIKWMERLPNGQYYWQVSLDKAMQQGRQQFGPEWEGSPYTQQTGIMADQYDNKKAWFFDWLERVPPTIVHSLKGMIDDHLDKTEGFRPFDTANESSDTDVEPWSVEELEERWK